MILNEYNYEDIPVGKEFEFEKVFSLDDLKLFQKLTGDSNPLHTDKEYAMESGFEDQVVYGLLAGSLFSSLVGMMCPGKNNIYLTQNYNFKKPVYPNRKLIVRGKILDKIPGINMITIKTEILSEENILIDGIAKVKIREN